MQNAMTAGFYARSGGWGSLIQFTFPDAQCGEGIVGGQGGVVDWQRRVKGVWTERWQCRWRTAFPWEIYPGGGIGELADGLDPLLLPGQGGHKTDPLCRERCRGGGDPGFPLGLW